MPNVNPPIAALSRLNLPKPLLDFLNQLWERTGGYEDFIESLSFTTEAEDSRKFTELRQLTKQVKDLERQVEALQAQLIKPQPKAPEDASLEARLKQLESRIRDLELT